MLELRQRKADDRGLQQPRPAPPHALSAGGSGGEDVDLAAADAVYEAAKAKGLLEVKRVKALLADQQRSLREVRHAYASELAARTSRQQLLRQCLLDVRAQVARQDTPGYALDKALRAAKEHGPASSKSLTLLRSQDRVVSAGGAYFECRNRLNRCRRSPL